MTKAPALSPTTRDLLTRLDAVMAAQPPQPGLDAQSENDLMAQHVRSVINADGEPVFTEDVLKMAFIELIQMQRSKEVPTTTNSL